MSASGKTDREAAWDELHAALPPVWVVGSPSYHDERREWVLYAFDPAERSVMGVSKREWQAVANSEVGRVCQQG
jgi:hypothetical protein